MHGTRKLWRWLATVCLLSFAVLGWVGREIYVAAPPIPQKVVSETGDTLFSKDQVQRGQQAWLSAGGQQLGTVWGHGAYVAPDWSADWLHREASYILERWSRQEHGQSLKELAAEPKAALEARLQQEMRTNRFDPESRTLTVSAIRAEAISANARYYTGLFMNDPVRE